VGFMGQRRPTSLPSLGGSAVRVPIPLGSVSRSFDYSDRVTGNPEVMPRMDSQRCWPEVGFVEVKSLFTFYPREHRSPVQSYGL